ncbi:aquaporin AQPAe.a [Selaginella moellendorffii]|uniref:aquaporin AQPAe.a n=1 Tax=Selaginella moellendorffii TaxID=88036 RepID=UPI000D1C3F7C|nr:aquaporin AQPAe.a [Selaginella moellendorffii]|eukprot:XP_024528162.1 aquaporin AQPAe.a [Selaginella moellendorffii]
MVEGALKMVSMLNFMKVELGDHKTLRSKEQWRAAGAEFLGTLLFVYLGCGSVIASEIHCRNAWSGNDRCTAGSHSFGTRSCDCFSSRCHGSYIRWSLKSSSDFGVRGCWQRNTSSSRIISILRWSTPGPWVGALGAHDLSNGVYPGQGFIMEFMLTFVLVFVIFGVAVDRRGPGVIAPLPIGFAVLVDHLVGVPFTGASMNPARSFGPAVVSGAWSASFWIYWFGPCFGAAAASALYK